MLYLGLKKKYEHLSHHNIYISEDYKQNFDDIKQGMLSNDLSFYIQNPSFTDESLAPEGHSAMYVLVPVPNLKGDIDWQKQGKSFRNRVIKLMKERAGLDDIENHIEFEKMVTPSDWENNYRVGFGACFNLAHNIGQMLYFRPRNKFEEIESLWLVGGGTNPGSGLPTIYESGRITAHGIMKKYNITPPHVITPPVSTGIKTSVKKPS